jgi:hypothetical protein
MSLPAFQDYLIVPKPLALKGIQVKVDFDASPECFL